MIHTKPSFSNEFLKRYKEGVAENKVFAHICQISQHVPNEYKGRFEYFFNLKNITKLIFLPSNFLAWYVREITLNLPIIIQRYNPVIFLSRFDLGIFPTLPSSTKKNDDKAIVLKCRSDVMIELNRIKENNNCIVIDSLLAYLSSVDTPSAVRKKLESIITFLRGESWIFDEHYSNQFPKWVNMLESAFDYDYVSKNFAYEICGCYGVNFCPYCNDEPIHIIDSSSKKYRPHLDHFLPKSRYPFLGVSLYNLIPAGTRCNSYFKLMRDTLNASNPNLKNDKIPHQQIFLINYPPDDKINLDDISVVILDVNEKFKLNSEMFGLTDVYNKDDVKQELAWLIEKIEFLRGAGSLNETLNDFDKLYMHLKINIRMKANGFRWKKLLLDAVNQVTDSTFNSCI